MGILGCLQRVMGTVRLLKTSVETLFFPAWWVLLLMKPKLSPSS
ncbi:hypothetical protein O77CONTIG1_01239 [Leptolyngbya sp. O-77]|nr:hypothetical protein O77CONTIG1_01239 [Leptolyngbya sp. O-77]